MAYNKENSPKHWIMHNFIGGFSWGVGSALGAALLVTILGFILTKINVVPMIGTFVSQVNTFVEKQKTR
ncbi:MAG: DUF5665 domain-containing protein [Candidatus Levyibacteriota bacterium]